MYGKVFRRYMLRVHEAAPSIPAIELFWRVHFMLGAAAFSMSGIKALRAIAENDFGARTSIEQVMRMMVPFLAAGMRADSGVRSEEHTSELQSLMRISYAVFCLKKKKHCIYSNHINDTTLIPTRST